MRSERYWYSKVNQIQWVTVTHGWLIVHCCTLTLLQGCVFPRSLWFFKTITASGNNLVFWKVSLVRFIYTWVQTIIPRHAAGPAMRLRWLCPIVCLGSNWRPISQLFIQDIINDTVSLWTLWDLLHLYPVVKKCKAWYITSLNVFRPKSY